MNGGIGGFAGPNDLGKPETTLGGYGSGWQGSKKATVEGSLVLTASVLVRKKALVLGAQTAGSWGWIYEGEDGPHATMRYEADLRDTDNAWLRLHYRANGEAVDYKVKLVTTKPNYGGYRWWFICPIVRRDGGPPRRVAKLYRWTSKCTASEERGCGAHSQSAK